MEISVGLPVSGSPEISGYLIGENPIFFNSIIYNFLLTDHFIQFFNKIKVQYKLKEEISKCFNLHRKTFSLKNATILKHLCFVSHLSSDK